MACTSPVECFLGVNEITGKPKLFFREPVGVDPQSYSLFWKPCGRCASCLEARARDMAVRSLHESRMHKANCFITCTYSDAHLPRHGSLSQRDAQLFLKRLRKYFPTGSIRYVLVGEYGSHTYRAHLHALIFGVDFLADRKPAGKTKSGYPQWTSATLDKAWGVGNCTVSALTIETCMYTCRYALKSALATSRGERGMRWWQHPLTGQWLQREREFMLMSRRPGLGRAWFDQFHADVTTPDAVILPGGRKMPVPRYYDKVVREWSEDDFQRIKERRLEQAMEGARPAESAPKRLLARAEVQQAKHDLSKRGL